MFEEIIETFKAIYYELTKFIPRRLPQTKEEFEDLKYTLETYLGLDRDPVYWYTVCSQITRQDPDKSPSIFKPYTHYLKSALKLKINGLAQDQKILAGEQIKANLEVKIKDETERNEVPTDDGYLGGSTKRIVPQWSDVQTATPNI